MRGAGRRGAPRGAGERPALGYERLLARREHEGGGAVVGQGGLEAFDLARPGGHELVGEPIGGAGGVGEDGNGAGPVAVAPAAHGQRRVPAGRPGQRDVGERQAVLVGDARVPGLAEEGIGPVVGGAARARRTRGEDVAVGRERPVHEAEPVQGQARLVEEAGAQLGPAHGAGHTLPARRRLQREAPDHLGGGRRLVRLGRNGQGHAYAVRVEGLEVRDGGLARQRGHAATARWWLRAVTSAGAEPSSDAALTVRHAGAEPVETVARPELASVAAPDLASLAPPCGPWPLESPHPAPRPRTPAAARETEATPVRTRWVKFMPLTLPSQSVRFLGVL